jgi:hypothetical protein
MKGGTQMPHSGNKGNYVNPPSVKKTEEEKNDWIGFFAAIAAIIALLIFIVLMV